MVVLSECFILFSAALFLIVYQAQNVINHRAVCLAQCSACRAQIQLANGIAFSTSKAVSFIWKAKAAHASPFWINAMSGRGSAFERAANAAVQAVDKLQIQDAGSMSGFRKLDRAVSSIERRAQQLKTLDDLVRCANLDSPAPPVMVRGMHGACMGLTLHASHLFFYM